MADTYEHTYSLGGSGCEINILKSELATALADKESFGVKVNEAAVREGNWLKLFGLRPGADLTAAIKSTLDERAAFKRLLNEKE